MANTRECAICGKTFVLVSSGRKLYCSAECARAGQRAKQRILFRKYRAAAEQTAQETKETHIGIAKAVNTARALGISYGQLTRREVVVQVPEWARG